MDKRAIAKELVKLMDRTTGHALPRSKITTIQGVFECYLFHKLGRGDREDDEITKVSKAMLQRLFDKKTVKAGCLQRLGREAEYKRELDDLSMILMCARTLLGDDHTLVVELDKVFQGIGSQTKEIQYERNDRINRSNNAPDPGYRRLLPGDRKAELPEGALS